MGLKTSGPGVLESFLAAEKLAAARSMMPLRLCSHDPISNVIDYSSYLLLSQTA